MVDVSFLNWHSFIFWYSAPPLEQKFFHYRRRLYSSNQWVIKTKYSIIPQDIFLASRWYGCCFCLYSYSFSMQTLKDCITNILQGAINWILKKARGQAFIVCLCNVDRSKYKLHGVYSILSAFRVSITNLQNQSQISWWSFISKRSWRHKSNGWFLLRAVLQDSYSVFLTVLFVQFPSLKASSSSIVTSNENLSL